MAASTATTYPEPSDLELGMHDRANLGHPPIGPLTLEQHEGERAYERYCTEREADYQAEQAAGGRTVCPECGERPVTHRPVCTYGYAAHPEAEFSDLAKCERCDYAEV